MFYIRTLKNVQEDNRIWGYECERLKALSEALKNNYTLTELDLSGKGFIMIFGRKSDRECLQ